MRSPAETWEAVYADCEAAQSSIDFEQYIFRNDELGKRFLDLFAKKVGEGVRVRIVFDCFGSLGPYYSPNLVRKLRRSGVKVRFYHPLHFFHFLVPWVVFPRTHAKTMLIDARIAYVGGVCFSEEMRDWRDTMARITGPVTEQVQTSFDRLWIRRGWQRYAKGFHVGRIGPDPDFRLAISLPRFKHNPIYEELRDHIRHATKRVLITTPYFIPSRSFVRLLGAAVQRGVDVRVMIGEMSDVRVADFATRSYLPALLARGVKVFLYRDSVLHAKVMVVDDHWATLGSMNLDYLSVFRNRENNLIITDSSAVEELAGHFNDDMGNCRQFTVDDWRRMPFWKKLLGAFCRIFHPIL